MSIKNHKQIVLFLTFIVFIFFIKKNYERIQLNNVINEIRGEFSGIVIKKIEYRKGIVGHLKLRRKFLNDTIVNAPDTIMIKINDILIKNRNSPFCYLKRGNSPKVKLIYTYLSQENYNLIKEYPEFKNEDILLWKTVINDK